MSILRSRPVQYSLTLTTISLPFICLWCLGLYYRAAERATNSIEECYFWGFWCTRIDIRILDWRPFLPVAIMLFLIGAVYAATRILNDVATARHEDDLQDGIGRLERLVQSSERRAGLFRDMWRWEMMKGERGSIIARLYGLVPPQHEPRPEGELVELPEAQPKEREHSHSSGITLVLDMNSATALGRAAGVWGSICTAAGFIFGATIAVVDYGLDTKLTAMRVALFAVVSCLAGYNFWRGWVLQAKLIQPLTILYELIVAEATWRNLPVSDELRLCSEKLLKKGLATSKDLILHTKEVVDLTFQIYDDRKGRGDT